MQRPSQLAFAHIDRSAALDERIEDLLLAAERHVSSDHVRALYFANEARILAETEDRTAAELRALRLIIAALQATGRTGDATPYIVRAIDLADSIADADLLSSLVDALGAWAISVENEPSSTPEGHRSTRDWAVAAIAGLERARKSGGTAGSPEASENAGARADFVIDDPETGLLNALGLAAELLSLEESQIGYAVIQIVVSKPDLSLIAAIAQCAAQYVSDRGLVARNGSALLTAVLPSFTGIAAMAMAEHLRVAITKLAGDEPATVGIGVAIKQPSETSRDVLRRVTDRAEEAGRQPGITVAG